MDTIHVLYLDDCDIDHRLFDAYVKMDVERDYELIHCSSLDQALTCMEQKNVDALVIDNRMPPFRNYHEPYRTLKARTGFDGKVVIVSADISSHELEPEKRQDCEIVVDKADLMSEIREGLLHTLTAASAQPDSQR